MNATAATQFMSTMTPAQCSVIANKRELAECYAVELDAICIETGEDYEAVEREVMSMIKDAARTFRLS